MKVLANDGVCAILTYGLTFESVCLQAVTAVIAGSLIMLAMSPLQVKHEILTTLNRGDA